MNQMIIIILILSLQAILFAQMKNEPQTVKYVDVKKYAGLWYEIAKIPNKFQKDCAGGTTAEYKLMDGGKIKVVNTCIDENGEKDMVEGVAKVVNKNTNAKLEVSFFSFLGIRPFWGDYWIIGLDPDYKYAVIGHPERKYGWILSREPELTEVYLNEVYAILKSNGYNKNNFVFTKQRNK